MTPRQWWDLYDFKLLQQDPKRAAAESGPRMSRAELDALEKQIRG